MMKITIKTNFETNESPIFIDITSIFWVSSSSSLRKHLGPSYLRSTAPDACFLHIVDNQAATLVAMQSIAKLSVSRIVEAIGKGGGILESSESDRGVGGSGGGPLTFVVDLGQGR